MASIYWVGGPGQWTPTNAANWSLTSGAAGGVRVPAITDLPTFDANSGLAGGQVTVNYGGLLQVQGIIFGAMVGTLDFATFNNNVRLDSTTAALSGTGTSTRGFNMGSGTWTIVSTSLSTAWNFATVTGLTFSGANANVVFDGVNPGRRTIALGTGLTYGRFTFKRNTGRGSISMNGPATFKSLELEPLTHLMLNNSTIYTIQEAFDWAGTATEPIGIVSVADTGFATIAAAAGGTIDGGVLRQVTFTGAGAKTAINSLDLGLVTGITVTPPAAGGGVAEGYPVKVWNGTGWDPAVVNVADGGGWGP
jgi:hypothetical protein